MLGPWSSTEVYANWGLGFHSNDARGAVQTRDPKTGEPVRAVDPIVRARGAELGVRTLALRRFQTTIAAGDRIPGAVEGVASAGLTVQDLGGFSGSLRLRYFGPRPLIEDNSVRPRASTALNARLRWRIAKRYALNLDVFNLTDAEVGDVDYFYASRLPGEPAEGVNDVHTHPLESRSFRLSVIATF